MKLTEPEIQQAISQVKAAFPNLTDWEYNEAIEKEYEGFIVAGCYTLEFGKFDHRHFYITIDAPDEFWRGHLSIGMPAYMWTSADFGDAFLVDTEPCQTVEAAIEMLKIQITNLLGAFCTA